LSEQAENATPRFHITWMRKLRELLRFPYRQRKIARCCLFGREFVTLQEKPSSAPIAIEKPESPSNNSAPARATPLISGTSVLVFRRSMFGKTVGEQSISLCPANILSPTPQLLVQQRRPDLPDLVQCT